MARGGGKGRRTYARDARGRFASTGSSAPKRGAVKPGGGTLKARASLARSRSRLAAADATDRSIGGTLSRRSQKGAVTRAQKALKKAKKEARVRLKVGPKKGTIRKPKGTRLEGKLARKTALQKRADALLRVHGARLINEELGLRKKSGNNAERKRIREQIDAMPPETLIKVIKRFVAGRRRLVRPMGPRRAKAVKARTDGTAFSQRFSRANEVWRKRYLEERDREDRMSSSERRSVPFEKRSASSQRREARSRQTAQRAMEFYRTYGSPSAFGMRQVERTSSSPRFGTKTRRRKSK